MAVDLGSMRVVLQAKDTMSPTLNKAKTNVGGFSKAIQKMGIASKLGFAAVAYAVATAVAFGRWLFCETSGPTYRIHAA